MANTEELVANSPGAKSITEILAPIEKTIDGIIATFDIHRIQSTGSMCELLTIEWW